MITVMDGTPSQMFLGQWNTIYYVSGTLLGHGEENCQNLLLKRNLRITIPSTFSFVRGKRPSSI